METENEENVKVKKSFPDCTFWMRPAQSLQDARKEGLDRICDERFQVKNFPPREKLKIEQQMKFEINKLKENQRKYRRYVKIEADKANEEWKYIMHQIQKKVSNCKKL